MYYIVLDESGAMHIENERYFVLAGYYTKSLNYVKSKQLRLEKDYLLKKGITDFKNYTKEIKGSDLSKAQRQAFLEGYFFDDHIHPIAIIADKKHINFHRDGQDENSAYCYFCNQLYSSLLKNKRVCPHKKVSFHIDQRTIANNMKRDLPTHLKYTTVSYGISVDLNFQQLDSKKSPEGRMADIIANSIFNYYNDYQGMRKRIDRDFNLKSEVFMNHFPFKKFGK